MEERGQIMMGVEQKRREEVRDEGKQTRVGGQGKHDRVEGGHGGRAGREDRRGSRVREGGRTRGGWGRRAQAREDAERNR